MALRRRSLLDYDGKGCSDDDRQTCSPPFPPSPPAIDTPDAIPPPPLSPPATPIQLSNKNHLLILVVVVVAASVLAVCLLSLAYYAVQRYRSSRRRRAAAATWAPAQPPSDDPEWDLLREDLLVSGAGEEPYHVWYIRTAGLDEAVIGRIAVWEYKKGEGVVESADCAVCLGEFSDGEPLRLLPKCSHAFHVPCIDTWLRSHVNCPLCRAPILAPLPYPAAAPGGAGLGFAVAALPTALPSDDGDGEDGSDSDESTEVSLPGQVADAGFDRARPPAGDSFSPEESEIWVPIDLGDDDSLCAAAAPEERDAGVELQRVRRSMSMDSSAVAGVLLRTRVAGTSRDGWRKSSLGDDKKGGAGENNCKGPSLAHEVERSMSGGRFFLSRLSGRALRAAVLPL